MSKALDTIRELQAKFYNSNRFQSFYTSEYRMKQVQKALKDKRTSAAERLQWIKYLDAHVGDVPAKGPDSGVVEIKSYSVGDLKKAMEE